MRIVIREQVYNADTEEWEYTQGIAEEHVKDFSDVNKALFLINKYNFAGKDQVRYSWSLETE